MLEQSLQMLSQQDGRAVIAFLEQQQGPLAVANTYSELVKHLYWQEKDVAAMVTVARAGLQYALARGALAMKQDIDTARQLRSEAKTIAYNLASFTWIGWDEPGIVLSKSDQSIGLEAAKTNLRLAFELQKGDMRISRGYWMKAAQLTAAGDWTTARYDFDKAATYAERAGAAGDELIARAFALLVEQLLHPRNTAVEARLEQLKEQFPPLEHGQMYLDQIATAGRVFAGRS